jgi:hypothetical protein
MSEAENIKVLASEASHARVHRLFGKVKSDIDATLGSKIRRSEVEIQDIGSFDTN